MEGPTSAAGSERLVIGYHGTSISRARSILRTQSFLLSKNDFDWLGHGIYFWEGPARAWEWAARKYGASKAVVCATISLGRCLDLTDAPAWRQAFDSAFRELEEFYVSLGKPLPVNIGKRRSRDCLVFNYVASREGADTVRSVALEGSPLFEGTEHRTQQHIQLCVRNQGCIRPPIELVQEAPQ